MGATNSSKSLLSDLKSWNVRDDRPNDYIYFFCQWIASPQEIIVPTGIPVVYRNSTGTSISYSSPSREGETVGRYSTVGKVPVRIVVTKCGHC